MREITHVAYADESNYNAKQGTYPAIALISLPLSEAQRIKTDLNALLQDSEVNEFKWKKMGSAKYRFAAEKMIRYMIEEAQRETLRIDVLTWDLTDERHDIPQLDKIANLQRMYYQLFKHIMKVRWPNDCCWHLFPDQQTALDWNEVHYYLGTVSTTLKIESTLDTPLRLALQNDFFIENITEQDSSQELLVQVADLFAGMGSYSRTSYDAYEAWINPMPLFGSQREMSNADQERCKVIEVFDNLCKKHRLGVSLKSNRGLMTYDPNNPINFWWYVPQHAEDKAPSKSDN
ncbi:MAG: DUF3800 domain-containing protein [Anaerolineales bacterium]|nr:DUF3800 domain-containing protein [Anaerolineales bacterium]